MIRELNDPEVVAWLSTTAKLRKRPWNVMTTGSGPWSSLDLRRHLSRRGIGRAKFVDACSLMIVGRQGWDQSLLHRLIDAKRGDTLKVYSQEMFLLQLLTGADPFDTPSVLPSFKAGHPALEALAEGWPGWVTTRVPMHGRNGGLTVDSPDAGVLKCAGYSVSKDGPSERERRAVLETVFGAVDLSGPWSSQYAAQWGRPESSKRLHKMAETIASLCRNMKRGNRTGLHQAIRKWERDLGWLKERYYYGTHRFTWPSTIA